MAYLRASESGQGDASPFVISQLHTVVLGCRAQPASVSAHTVRQQYFSMASFGVARCSIYCISAHHVEDSEDLPEELALFCIIAATPSSTHLPFQCLERFADCDSIVS